MSLVDEQGRAIEAIRNLANLGQRLAPILTTTDVLISQRQQTRESLERLRQAVQRVLAAFIANRENLTGIIQQIDNAVNTGTNLQTEQLSSLRQSLEASVAGNNSADAITSLIAQVNDLIGQIDQEIPPPPPQRGGFVWRTPPKTPNTPRLTLNKTTSPVRNNVLIRTKTRKTRTKTRKTRTKTKKSNPKTIISRRTRSKSRS